MITEGGIFSLPSIWIMDASNNRYLDAVGMILGMLLVFVGAAISLTPVCILIETAKRQSLSHN